MSRAHVGDFDTRWLDRYQGGKVRVPLEFGDFEIKRPPKIIPI